MEAASTGRWDWVCVCGYREGDRFFLGEMTMTPAGLHEETKP